MNRTVGLLYAAAVFFFLAQTLYSQQPLPATVKAGVHLDPPFVMAGEDGRLYGMAVELWEEAAAALGVETRYVRYRTMQDMLAAAEAGNIDMVITNLTVTHDRTRYLKYSFPWFDSGLRIMVSADSGISVIAELIRTGQFKTYLLLFGVLILLAVLVTLIRRRFDPEFPRGWKEGITCSFHDLVAMAKSGSIPKSSDDTDVKVLKKLKDRESFTVSELAGAVIEVREKKNRYGWIGYVLSAVWMLFGVGLVAYVTSTVTATMTTLSLVYEEINSFYDLPGKRTGVFAGTASEYDLRYLGTNMVPLADIEEAAEALSAGSIQAVVADAPVLEYYVLTHPEFNFTVTGELFRPDKYAFAAAGNGAGLIDTISVELIKLHENGYIRSLKLKYFGTAE
ncbi:transporter substrate-binding domain-containing protein [Breznakiella homolactica]|uniref:Transporter substrate-binding domain-containing protein n=1 Tax=Breznakiella homolactica TaxID=2798577 RepID=A0A7T8BCD5_9SPIR|nr:transporter substrate-binding domain-containing protein [Breznakiella homolactica]QQO10143.1 transporter substrate-binding domain-containing protein [Breznakiella homolactica]